MSSPPPGFTPLGHPAACLWGYMANGSFHDELLSDHKTTIVSLTHQMNADERRLDESQMSQLTESFFSNSRRSKSSMTSTDYQRSSAFICGFK